MNATKFILLAIVCFVADGAMIGATLKYAPEGLPKYVIVTGLSILGIIGLPYLIFRILWRNYNE